MKISDASNLSDVPAKTIRYYEEIGLIGPTDRTDGGYRDYGQADIKTLCLVRQMRHVGFSVDECRQLLTQLRHDDFDATDNVTTATEWKMKLAERLSELRKISKIVGKEIMVQQTSNEKIEKTG